MKMTLKKKDQTKRAKIKSKKDTENHRKCLFNPRSDNLSPTSTCYTYTTAVQTKLHTHTHILRDKTTADENNAHA